MVVNSSCITRNHTSAFIRLRKEKSSKRNRFGPSILDTMTSNRSVSEGEQALLETGAAPNSNSHINDGLPPMWLENVENINHEMTQVQFKMDDLAKKQSTYMLKVFGDDRSATTEIANLTGEIQRAVHSIESSIKNLWSENLAVSSQEYRLRQNAQKALMGRLQEKMSNFKKSEKKYMQAFESRQGDQMEIEQAVKQEGYAEKSMFTEYQNAQLEYSEFEAQQRNEEITRVARSMKELSSMFKEMSTMVIEQGTVLDRIDMNIDDIDMQVGKANQELVIAEKRQRESKVMQALQFLTICIFVELLIIVIKILF